MKKNKFLLATIILSFSTVSIANLVTVSEKENLIKWQTTKKMSIENIKFKNKTGKEMEQDIQKTFGGTTKEEFCTTQVDVLKYQYDKLTLGDTCKTEGKLEINQFYKKLNCQKDSEGANLKMNLKKWQVEKFIGDITLEVNDKNVYLKSKGIITIEKIGTCS